MKTLLFAMASLLATHLALAGTESVLRISKEQLARFEKLPPGVTVSVTGEPADPVIKIVSEGRGPVTVELLTLSKPPLSMAYYAIRGEVSYAEVAGDGYLETWNWFGESIAYFSRTLGADGPLGKLTGDSGWRGCLLPFNASETGTKPTKLVMNVVLPGKGSVTLRHLELQQAASFEALLGGKPAWWSDRATRWISGLAGALIGCLGSLLEYLSSRGRARPFVVAATWALIGLGAASAIAGLIALLTAQPAGVSYLLLLAGLLCVLIFPARLFRYTRNYRETELRRMASLDAVGV